MEHWAQSSDSVPKVHSHVSVETPEQIQFTFELAGTSVRMLAYLIDFVIRCVGAFLVGLVLFLAMGWASPEFAIGLILILMFVVEWGYYTVFEWLWSGATPGKRALGIRVVRTNGVAVDIVRSALRNLLRAADIFPFAYCSGMLVMFFSGTHRRLGDLAADTMVIREERVRLRELPTLPAGSVELPPGLLKETRLTDRDLALIDEFFRRYHLFSKDRANELAEILTQPIAVRLGLDRKDSVKLLAGILQAGSELRTSWYGRMAAISSPPSAPPGGAR
jgi:uncharacterized RDD family membrane protein YckC